MPASLWTASAWSDAARPSVPPSPRATLLVPPRAQASSAGPPPQPAIAFPPAAPARCPTMPAIPGTARAWPVAAPPSAGRARSVSPSPPRAAAPLAPSLPPPPLPSPPPPLPPPPPPRALPRPPPPASPRAPSLPRQRARVRVTAAGAGTPLVGFRRGRGARRGRRPQSRDAAAALRASPSVSVRLPSSTCRRGNGALLSPGPWRSAYPCARACGEAEPLVASLEWPWRPWLGHGVG
eukprot:scaffold12077_cov61-Phaeocystis_antarctica.AAC.3